MPMSADHIHKIICSHTPNYNYMNARTASYSLKDDILKLK
jgi:hypothetical protein